MMPLELMGAMCWPTLEGEPRGVKGYYVGDFGTWEYCVSPFCKLIHYAKFKLCGTLPFGRFWRGLLLFFLFFFFFLLNFLLETARKQSQLLVPLDCTGLLNFWVRSYFFFISFSQTWKKLQAVQAALADIL